MTNSIIITEYDQPPRETLKLHFLVAGVDTANATPVSEKKDAHISVWGSVFDSCRSRLPTISKIDW